MKIEELYKPNTYEKIKNILKESAGEIISLSIIKEHLNINASRFALQNTIHRAMEQYPEIEAVSRKGYIWNPVSPSNEVPYNAPKQISDENDWTALKSMKNHEGYSDPTASLAINSVYKERINSDMEGHVYESQNSAGFTDDILIIKAFKKYALYLTCYDSSSNLERDYMHRFEYRGHNYYIDASLVSKKPVKYIDKQTPVFSITKSELESIKKSVAKALGIDISPKVKVIEKKVEVPVEKVVEKIVEVPVEKIVETKVQVQDDSIINENEFLKKQVELYEKVLDRLLVVNR